MFHNDTIDDTTILLFDIYRNHPYIEFIKNNVKDKVVVDCGSGNGIWTWVALYYGAKFVYAVDINKSTIEHLKFIYKDNKQVEVLELNLFKSVLPKGDVYIHEIFSDNLFGEGLISFLKNCKEQNISNIFPSELTLYSLANPSSSTTPASFDYSLMQESVIAFLNHLENAYNKPINRTYYTSMLKTFNFSCDSKTKIWEGKLLDLLNQINIKVNDNFISWETGQGDLIYSSLNRDLNSWPRGYTTVTEFKKDYLKYLRRAWLPGRSAIAHVNTTPKFI